MAYQLELGTSLYTESPEGIKGPCGCYWSDISIFKDGVPVVMITNIGGWPNLWIHPLSSMLTRIVPKFGCKEYKPVRIDGELKDGSDLGIVIFSEDMIVEFYRKGIGFFRVLKEGGMLFNAYHNNSGEIFFEKIEKRCKEIPLSEVRKEVIDGE